MQLLLVRGRPAKVEGKHLEGALDVVSRALRDKVAKVATVVAHCSILPVDEAYVVALDKKVGAIEVIVAEDGLACPGSHGLDDLAYALRQKVEVLWKWPALVLQELG